MENHQLLPFERNRYYTGKLLTTADFLAEQTYLNNKRRFLSSLMFGAGVVCGLSVYNLDDQSIMVESGVALDGLGREIVLQDSVVKKLSALDGFEELEGDSVSLCLRYVEDAVHPVYSVGRQGQGDEYELNRIREGWQLLLTDTAKLEPPPAVGDEFLNQAQIYGDEDYGVFISLPAQVSCGSRVRLTVAVEKRSQAQHTFSLECLLQTPAFVSASGEHELEVKLEDVRLEAGETLRREYWVQVQSTEAAESMIVAKTSFARITVDGVNKRMADNFFLKVSVCDIPVEDLVEREIGKVSLELRGLDAPELIRLADFTLQRTQNAYIIERVDEYRAKQYIRTAATDSLRREYNAYFDLQRPAERAAPGASAADPVLGGGAEPREPMYASGVCEIPLRSNMRRGDIEYSDEIMHGLGKGNVFVSVGVEYLADDPRVGGKAKQTIYGDASLFAGEEPPVVYAETAVKVRNDRGSFVVAAKLLEETSYVMMVLRWVAIRLPSVDDPTLLQRLSGKSIAAVQPTVVLATRESHYFNVTFKNMEPCALLYELTDPGSGEITADGIYTAPAKEGVYEIRITCADMPLITTYAYAVVKKRVTESADKEPKTT